MKIKRFRAKTFAEALTLVKREMGADAVILSTEEQKGLIRGVEVTAAVDYELQSARAGAAYAQYSDLPASDGTRTYSFSPEADLLSPAPERKDSPRSAANAENVTDIGREIRQLRGMLEDMKKTGLQMDLPAGRKKVFSYLRKRAVREELALQLSGQDPAAMSDLVNAMASGMRTYQDAERKKIVMLIGPTGVGKTTTIAKLAARAIRDKKRAALINLDTYRIGAIEQIRIYSNIMRIPLETASTAPELKKSVEKFRDRDIIFMDTTGRNPRDKRYIEDLRTIYRLGIPIETHLLMSAGSDDDFLVEAYRHYKDLPIDCIAFTKTDEAVRYGSIYNLASLYRKPVAYITTGQNVPADIEFPDSRRLARMILKNEAA